MRTITGVLSATIAMHTDNLLVGLTFGTIFLYVLYGKIKTD